MLQFIYKQTLQGKQNQLGTCYQIEIIASKLRIKIIYQHKNHSRIKKTRSKVYQMAIYSIVGICGGAFEFSTYWLSLGVYASDRSSDSEDYHSETKVGIYTIIGTYAIIFMPFLIWTFIQSKDHDICSFLYHLFRGYVTGIIAGTGLLNLFMAYEIWGDILLMDQKPSFLKTTLFKIVNTVALTILMILISTDLSDTPQNKDIRRKLLAAQIGSYICMGLNIIQNLYSIIKAKCKDQPVKQKVADISIQAGGSCGDCIPV